MMIDIILNDDRHFSNIAVINSNNKFKLCPIFDNGASFLSNTIRYPYEMSIKANIQRAKSKPLSTTFIKQLELALSMSDFHFNIDKLFIIHNKIREYLKDEGYYTSTQHNRILFTYLQQIQTYKKILEQNNSHNIKSFTFGG